MQFNISSIINNFKIVGKYLEAEIYGSGHIHDSFLIRTAEDACHNYFLQRINHEVFKNIPQLMGNIEKVTNHIRAKLQKIPDTQPDRECLTLVHTKDDCTFFQDKQDNYWRVFIFIDRTKFYDVVDSPQKAYQGGQAFGKFQALLADLPAELLSETIPDFHNIVRRLQTFFEVMKADPVQRATEVVDEAEIVQIRAEEMQRITQLGREGKIPLRITHNDTKYNNILFDEKEQAQCVVDLDTVMPGYVHYDFGDAIRTAANTGAEDEEDLSKVALDINLFEAFAQGFLEETKSFLTRTEIDYLAFSAKLLTFTMGLRFLTDYIDGDNYYKIHYNKHNLQRARTQFKLLASMEEQYDDMREIINRIAKS